MNGTSRFLLPALLFLAVVASSSAYEIQISSDASARTYSLANGKKLRYEKPGFFKDLGNIPSDTAGFFKNSFTKENVPYLAGIAGSTLILIKYDREIYEETRRFGNRLNISQKDKTETFLKYHGVSLFRGPTDLGSAIYFIGDGWVSIGLFASFKIYGLSKDDWRASSTANQLAEGLFATGLTTQFLKWASGRQMPKVASGDSTGAWHPFSGDYIKHRQRYDTFPSGHLATGTMCVTILAENYPEKTYIKPVGYSLLALLSFQMINNGVHWASDYPLCLAIGYGIGKSIASRHIVKDFGNIQKASNWEVSPYLAYSSSGLIVSRKF